MEYLNIPHYLNILNNPNCTKKEIVALFECYLKEIQRLNQELKKIRFIK